MSNNFIIRIKNHKSPGKNSSINFISDSLEPEDHLEIIELLDNKNLKVNINISKNNEIKILNNNLEIEDNKIKRSNSFICKKDYEIDDYFSKDLTIAAWSSLNINDYSKIFQENFILLKQIFDKRYKLFPNNVCSLSEFATHIKNKVDMYCEKDYKMSTFILYVLHSNFKELFKYIDEVVNFKNLNMDDFCTMKEILYHFGKDIKKIFKNAVNAIEKVPNFKFSNILIDMLNSYLRKKNILKEAQNIHAALMKEREEFESYIKAPYELKYTSNLSKWVNDIREDIIEMENKKEKLNISKKLNGDIYINDENKNLINLDNNNNKTSNKSTSNSTSKSNKADSIEKFNEIEEKDYYKENTPLMIMEKENNNDVNKLNIEDLVSYINEPKIKNSHKKKAKKKKKPKKENKEIKNIVQNNIGINNDNNENNLVEEDPIIADFKKCIEEFNDENTYIYPKKIEPNISESFIKKLEMYDE